MQLTGFLGDVERVRTYETREPYSSIEIYPPVPSWQTPATVAGTLLAFAGEFPCLF